MAPRVNIQRRSTPIITGAHDSKCSARCRGRQAIDAAPDIGVVARVGAEKGVSPPRSSNSASSGGRLLGWNREARDDLRRGDSWPRGAWADVNPFPALCRSRRSGAGTPTDLHLNHHPGGRDAGLRWWTLTLGTLRSPSEFDETTDATVCAGNRELGRARSVRGGAHDAMHTDIPEIR